MVKHDMELGLELEWGFCLTCALGQSNLVDEKSFMQMGIIIGSFISEVYIIYVSLKDSR